jgi:hypothetical protein
VKEFQGVERVGRSRKSVMRQSEKYSGEQHHGQADDVDLTTD